MSVETDDSGSEREPQHISAAISDLVAELAVMWTIPDYPTSHPDGCPACVEAVAEPHEVETHAAGRTTERYQCPRCDYRWWTSWDELIS